ncbi:MAG: LVIVD repeat-containing protein, partial [Bdellovibrionota bacterium]
YVATGDKGIEAVRISEFDEPQAIIGSYLHRYSYPDDYARHSEEKDQQLEESHRHHGGGGKTNAIQHRGEYLYTTAGEAGFRVYDIANIANKGFSERIVTAPVSPLGHDTHVPTRNATSFALPTNMPIAPFREQLPENQETPLHELYHYVVITDAEEGLILVNVDTLQDGEPRNNFLERALTWNEDGVLTGARHITLGGTNAFIATENHLVIVDLDKPLSPKVVKKIPFHAPRASALQFRYLFVVDSEGMHVVDVTRVGEAKKIVNATIPLQDARGVYLARTFAYVAGGAEGLVIVDIERPEEPAIYKKFTADGSLTDVNDVKVASTNASLFAYLADGKSGLLVVQLTDPERVPTYYGFSPNVEPKLIARKELHGAALAISKPLDRDRAVDETGHQVSVFGRLGSRPFSKEEMERMYLREDGTVYAFPNDW